MTEDHAPDPADDRPESLIRTPDDDSPHHSGGADDQHDDEDLDLRADTEEWQEYPSPNADPAAPESVAERMAGPNGEEGVIPEEEAGRRSPG
ncbi:MAG: hypothetical protein KIT69_11570 [Propionibacteriaceae bacterium]|nr:hypothetical protein [Propionibacteriaceae bacterium]